MSSIIGGGDFFNTEVPGNRLHTFLISTQCLKIRPNFIRFQCSVRLIEFGFAGPVGLGARV